ncbi:NUDIX hydrolase [Candidatus Parcubacteria bacterium]|nr:NUDIX hydrolase [Candidatus Parcubacteria bacterium]
MNEMIDVGKNARTIEELMEKISPIPNLELEVFRAICKKIPMVTVDLVMIHPLEKGKVLLTLRGPDDKFWPDKWHFPGGFVGYQEKMEEACERIAKEEVGVKLVKIQQIGINEHLIEEYARGHSVSGVYLAVPDRVPEKGQFFGKENIPKNLIKMHRRIFDLL